MPSPFLHLPRCHEVSAQLSEFLDGELAGEASHAVALHLAVCEACAQLAAELELTVHALHGLHGAGTPRTAG